LSGVNETTRTVLVACVAALLGVGAMMIYSTTSRGDGPLVSPTFIRQMLYVAFGVGCAFVLGRMDYHRLLGWWKWILAASLLLLVIVLIPGIGRRVNGASRWLRIGPVGFQPSEIAKLSLVLFLAAFLGSTARDPRKFKKGVCPALCVTGLICALVLVEPDIGTCLLLGAAAAMVLFIAGARLTHICAPALAAVPALVFIVSRGYARDRIEAWIDPWKDPAQTGYHIIQSLIAIGSGGISGVGLGASKQKLFFLPESQTDFIFAVLAEETGLVGVTLVMLLYAGFVFCGTLIAMRARDAAGRLLAAGITGIVALQTLINIAVVTKVFPTKGIALPFISAGGSSVVVMLACAGILYSIARHGNDGPFADPVV